MRRAGGRRYYRPLDLDLLRGIRVLLYEHRYTTKGVQKIFKDEGVKYVSELGRRAAAGEPVDIRPVLDDDDVETQTPMLELGAAEAFKAAPLTPEMRRTLQALLTRLESVEDALDQAALALEAIEAERQ